jgi:hypothetical protein
VDVSERTAISLPVAVGIRPGVSGKFMYLGEDKFYVRGATYGTFRPGAGGHQYQDPGVVERDFAQMAANGLNALRTYTVPPRWLLDAARWHGLYIMVGLPWEQHIAFLDDGRRARSIEDRVRACAGHPAALCYVIGSEIPASIVRWYGPRRVERYLERLNHAAAKLLPGLTILAPAQRPASTNSTSCSWRSPAKTFLQSTVRRSRASSCVAPLTLRSPGAFWTGVPGGAWPMA